MAPSSHPLIQTSLPYIESLKKEPIVTLKLLILPLRDTKYLWPTYKSSQLLYKGEGARQSSWRKSKVFQLMKNAV